MTSFFEPCYSGAAERVPVKDFGKGEVFFETPASRKLVDLIERNADELTARYIHMVQHDPRMPRYKEFDQKEIYKRAFRVYSQLGTWISRETTKEEVQSYWTALGRQRKKEGFPFSEIILSLCYIRRLLWEKVQHEGVMDTALDLYQAIDLHNRVVLFFDRAIFYAALGYEEKAGPVVAD